MRPAKRRPWKRRSYRVILLLAAGALLLPTARAASCKTDSQLTATERDTLANTARAMAGQVQSGDVQALRANTIPDVAANFDGIAASINALKPLVQHATITVNNLYTLNASTEPAGAPQTDFYCGTPVVVLNFTNLPPGKYALAILHATGVAQPQQISLILSETANNRWMLGGFFSNPMLEVGHNGLWYWEHARDYAQKKMNWDAWFYYQTAAYLLDPLQFLSSPNLSKLQHEADDVRPESLPEGKTLTLSSSGVTFKVTSLNVTGALGGFDLEVHYAPDAAQQTQLNNPVTARKQVVALMRALLEAHPELRDGFHGIWVHADVGDSSAFSLDLPMSEIVSSGTTLPRPASSPVASGR